MVSRLGVGADALRDVRGGAERRVIATGLSVCVVDDDGSVLRGVARLLRSAGFVVGTFSSAESFLDASGWIDQDCLIVDIHMPGLSGLAMQERLAAAGVAVPIVFITAHDDPTTREKARRAGGAYLRKPFDDTMLLEAIRGAIAARGGGPERP